jgi:hypothetical protein
MAPSSYSQSPAAQRSEQHWLESAQGVPICRHALLPQVPAVQALLQQSDA